MLLQFSKHLNNKIKKSIFQYHFYFCTWESKRSRYVRKEKEEKPNEIDQDVQQQFYRTEYGTKRHRIMNELIQDEETRPIRHKDVAKREETKQKSPERESVENEREIKRIEDRYYSANSKIPMYTEVLNREERDAESNEEIIQKYESVLSDINYEFKQLMKK